MKLDHQSCVSAMATLLLPFATSFSSPLTVSTLL
jgi:hypothetical protein